MTGAICGGGLLSRGIWRCPICKKRTRHLSQHSFGGYVTTHFCGGCGAVTQDGEWICRSKKDRAHYIQYVRDNWKFGRPLETVLDEMLKEMTE
jgi:hypothetical protein